MTRPPRTGFELNHLALPLIGLLLLGACNINVPLPGDQGQGAATNTPPGVETLATPVGTGEKPSLTITGNSNCRSGPGGSYDLITSFTPGTALELVGRNAANNYWQVRLPASEETCWVWGQYASASGDLDSLPESAPAEASGGAPSRPGSLYFKYTCPLGELTTNLTWSDAADNETGYRVYRFDIMLADLPANTTAFTDVVTVDPYADLQYTVEAYNSAGVSPSRTIEFKCQ